MRVGPGAEFYAISMGGGPIGYASSTVDTTRDGISVEDQLVLDIAALGKVQRTQFTTEIHLTRDFRLRSFEAMLDVPGSPFRASGDVSGDSVLAVTIEAGGQPSITRVRLSRPIVLSTLLPLELAFGHQLAPGKSYAVRVLDPMSMEERDVTVKVLAESTLVVPDSAVWDSAATRWVPVHQDTVRAWKVAEAFGSAYSASKFALIGLTQSMALEAAKHAITVNAICPGWVDTKMAGDQLSDDNYLSLTEQEPSQALEIARLSVPQMRFIAPEEVASLVVYLCSEQARGITGQAINICGGLSLH